MHANAKAPLEEHLPYELNMLQAAYEFLHKEEFADLRNIPFLKNTAIECYWMHARNLLDFLYQPKNISFDTRASASANDFTNKFYPEGIGRGILDDINQAITHLQYGRKSQPQETLDTWTMLRVKEHIDREIDNFEGAMTSDYKSAWKPRPRPQQILVYELASATNATTFATLLLVPGNR